MLVRVLGSGAGGGFPQWNCNCRNCRGVRDGSVRAVRRTQSSIAVSGDGERWVICNTSPDILAQIAANPMLQPGAGVRDTPIAAVVLTDSQIDHVTGLLMLREGCPIDVWCSDSVHEDLSGGFPLFGLLSSYNGGLRRHPVPIDNGTFEPLAGLEFTAVALSSKAPPYSPHRNDPHPGDTIGLRIVDTARGTRLFYAPGLVEVDATVAAEFAGADCVLVDGTFWREDEMAQAGLGDRPASAMGHLPQSGPDGMLARLAGIEGRRVLIHINNTNPILDEDSPERGEVVRAGVEVAFDGMALEV